MLQSLIVSVGLEKLIDVIVDQAVQANVQIWVVKFIVSPRQHQRHRSQDTVVMKE